MIRLTALKDWLGRKLCANGWHDDVASVPERTMAMRNGAPHPATCYTVLCMRCPSTLHVTHFDAPGSPADFERTERAS